MVRAWFMDNSKEDQRLEHHCDPPKFINVENLYKLSGVLHWKIDADNYETDKTLLQIKKDRGYSYQDIIEVSKDTLPNYEEKLKMFFEEHLHSDEEIRLVVSGSGYFDVRDADDRWIRVETSKGDLIILPAGIYHRFTLDVNNYVKAVRLFIGEPVWTPINRPADDHPARVAYVSELKNIEAAA